ncbi:DUF7835 family putative zinc beta-ribbon protein [Halogeometricum rufum]|jgi:DNA-directed RNA polymerase subunit RPC12/RpoP
MRDRQGETTHRTAEVRRCARCGETTAHRTSIRIEENASREDVQAENEKFSRQPYVVYCCSDCGRSVTEQVS